MTYLIVNHIRMLYWWFNITFLPQPLFGDLRSFMKPLIKYITRPAHRRDRIYQLLLSAIVSGKYAPGQRLPTRREFESIHNTSRITVQSALDKLQSEGFVEARGKAGSFVSLTAPHRNRFALVFSQTKGDDQWSNFHECLLAESLLYAKHAGIEIVKFGVDSPLASQKEILTGQIASHRLAGLIFSPCYNDLLEHPLFSKTKIPHVSIQVGPSPHLVSMDYESFHAKAAEHLQKLRKKRTAYLMLKGNCDYESGILRPILKQHGLELHPHLIQSVSSADAGWAGNLVSLLLSLPEKQRPDSFVIVDDHTVPEVTRALRGILGVSQRKIEIIAGSNFPFSTPAALPVKRLGFDLRKLFSLCFEALKTQKDSPRAKINFKVPATFQDELPQD